MNGVASISRKPARNSHQWIDALDLEMCRAIADKIRRNPRLYATAGSNLQRWKHRLGSLPALLEWETILSSRSRDEVLSLLAEDSHEGDRLRQNSPFRGLLTKAECAVVERAYDESNA